MENRLPCTCGYVSVNPDADSAVVCGGCGRPLCVPSGESTNQFIPDPQPNPDAPTEHIVRIRRKPSPTPPPEVPGYELLGELGRGGMGVVYKAREVALNRVVALKMILAGAHASAADRNRFKREAEAVAALHHAGIVQIFHVGEHAGQPFLVLEYVDGGNLADRIGDGDLLPVREAAAVVEQLATAMQYAHDQGVIHRDLKPANILLSKADGGGRKGDSSQPTGSSAKGESFGSAVRPPPSTVFKISDFGLAKKLDETVNAGGGTRTGAVMGTPSYISPEQAAGKSASVTATSDVYSLGAILYEILTDRPPFKADTPLETVLQVINDDPVPPSKLRPNLPRDLETICLKCLQKDPAKRYPTAGELAADLGRFLRGEPILARPVSAVARGWKWVCRHPAIAAFAATAAAALLAVVGVLLATNAQLSEANRQKANEAKAAREQEAIATAAKKDAEDKAREKAEALEELAAEGERNRRSLYALQLAQVAGIVARDPAAAYRLLEDPVKCPTDLRDFAWRYLRRLCGRAETIQTAHRRPVRTVVVSPDGQLVVTADAGGQVLVWHPHTRAVYAKLSGHTRVISSLAFAPDGSMIAGVSADGTVYLWKITTDLRDSIRLSARFLPDAQAEINRLLPSATPNFAVLLAPVATLPAFGHSARCVAFSADGQLLAAGGSDRERAPGEPDGVARVWAVADLLPPADAPRAAVLGTAASVAEWASSHPPAAVRPVRVVKDHLRPVCCVAFSPKGPLLATGSDDRGVILSQVASDKREELRLHGGPVCTLAFSPDGTTLATADNDENPVVVLWDVTKKRATEKRKLIGHAGAVNGLAFSGDGRTLATAADDRDRTVRVWDVETGTETARLNGHSRSVHAVGWLPDRRTLVSASEDGTARVWSTTLRTNETVALFSDEPAKVQAAALTQSGNTLVTADARGDVRFWSTEKLFDGRQGQAELPVYLTSGKPADAREWRVNGLAVSSDGLLVAVASPDGVRLWDLNSGRRVFGAAVLTVSPKLMSASTDARAVQITPDGGKLIALTADGLRVWDTDSGQDVTPVSWRTVQVPDTGGVMALSPDGRVLAASGVGPNQAPGLIIADSAGAWFTPLPAQVTTLDFSADGERLAVGVLRSPGLVCDVDHTPDGYTLTVACETAEPFSSMRFGREGKTILGVRGNRELVLLDAATGVERAVLSGHADSIVGGGFTPRDYQLITVGRDGAVKRWNGEPSGRPPVWDVRPPRPASPPLVVPRMVR
jgi:WD40 repeat protein/serine/threonine protein kinase